MNETHKKIIKSVRELAHHYFDVEENSEFVTHTGYRYFIDTLYLEFALDNVPSNKFEGFYDKFQKMKEDINQDIEDLDITVIHTFYPPNHLICVLIFTDKESHV